MTDLVAPPFRGSRELALRRGLEINKSRATNKKRPEINLILFPRKFQTGDITQKLPTFDATRSATALKPA